MLMFGHLGIIDWGSKFETILKLLQFYSLNTTASPFKQIYLQNQMNFLSNFVNIIMSTYYDGSEFILRLILFENFFFLILACFQYFHIKQINQ